MHGEQFTHSEGTVSTFEIDVAEYWLRGRPPLKTCCFQCSDRVSIFGPTGNFFFFSLSKNVSTFLIPPPPQKKGTENKLFLKGDLTREGALTNIVKLDVSDITLVLRDYFVTTC